MTGRKKAGFEEGLLRDGRLLPDDLARAIERARSERRPLARVLLEDGLVGEGDILAAQAEQYGLKFVRLEDVTVPAEAVRSVTAKFASHYEVMPVSLRAGVMTLAVSDPLDMSAAEDVEANLGFRVERVLACRDDVRKALRTYYGVGAETVEKILSAADEREESIPVEESHDLEKMAADASVVNLVNQLLQEAINDRATDIHFEAGRNGVIVRRRIDGVLYDTRVSRNMGSLYPAIVSRVKLMSGLNIVERRLPQDGRARVNIGRQQFDLRISIVPAMHGEDIVIRILPTAMLFDLGQLGFAEPHLALLREYIARPHGIIFVTGPTGSGKSTTLYACLSRLNERSVKIITIEDPVEYELPGITQTQINPKIGLSFSHALRSMLRHDPDVMMVGEVRDRETADIAIQTAMTGHLVLSTLHTNDAASAAVRLIDMGIDPYLVTSTVQLFIAQRLVRVICRDCKESHVVDGRVLYRGKGCKACNLTGYRGRIAIAEFLTLSREIQEQILKKASAKDIRDTADRQGMLTLAADGQEKVARGLTSLEEVLRVTSL